MRRRIFNLGLVLILSSFCGVFARPLVVLDTSLTVLDPLISCGINSQVRLQAGVATTYAWYRNGAVIPGATQRNYTASISGTYKVRVGDGISLIDSSRAVDVFIVPNPVASFTTNAITQCFATNSFSFTNTSTISNGTMTYTWYYGDAAFSLGTNGSHVYSNLGNYTVKLVATSNNGCVDSARQIVSVNPPPTVAFSVNNNAQCLNGNQFFFTNGSSIGSGALSYRWDFSDGSSSTQVSPAYSYTIAGNYTVKLVATSTAGCKDSVSQLITVHPKPLVSYTVNNNQQCLTNNFFQFTNTTTITSGSLTHFWNFGDAITSGAVSPSHSYLTPGTYQVKLLEVSNNGCADSVTSTMTVFPSPIALFTVNRTTDCFAGHQFVFTNASTISAGAMQYRWDFGDGIGTSTATNPVYSYATPGTYRVTLTVTSANNCTSTYSINLFLNPTPSGTIAIPTKTIICEGGFIQLQASAANFYQWNLGGIPINGATSSTYNATEPGVYSVTLTNTFNCSALASNTVTLTKVYQPTADFNWDRTCAQLTTTFTNLSFVTNSGVMQYAWTFGDGGGSAVFSPVHTYAIAGNYQVQLVATPVACPQLASTIRKPILIQQSPVSFRYAPVNAVSGRDLQLQAREFSGAFYTWVPKLGLSDSTISNPIFNHTAPQQYLIHIKTDAGCLATDTLYVRMFAARDFYVPDIFSPNGDGKNDRLTPLLVGIIKFKSFRVFDRWGQLVYQTGKEGEGWDGIYRGAQQPMETYTWIVEGLDLDGKVFQKTGTSILIR
jgi:gliding motility-associated-like protein